jgi:hypothetical protein
MAKENVKKILCRNRKISLVLFTLGQTPSYAEELSEELHISQPEIEKIFRRLLKLGLVQHVDSNQIQFDIFPLVYEKCSKVSPHDPLAALDLLVFYTISQKGVNYLSHAEKCIFRGCKHERK